MMKDRIFLSFLFGATLSMTANAWAQYADHGQVPDMPAGSSSQDKNTVRPEIGKPVQAAQQLLNQKKFKEALAQLHDADAVPNKTKYEAYVVSGTKAAIDLASGDDNNAINDLEAVLATGVLPSRDVLPRESAIAQLAFRVKDYAKAIDYAQRYYRDGGTDAGLHLLLAQSYYLQNDFGDAEKMARQIADDDAEAGRKSDENLFLILLSSADHQRDGAGHLDALERLVIAYPKPQYWNDLISAVQRSSGFSDRFALDADLLRIQTGALTRSEDYMQAAQMALQAGLPGDAELILAAGNRAGVLGKGDDSGREKRLSDMATRQANDDKAQLSASAKEADQAKDGLQWVKLGEAYLSYGQYADAVNAIEKGISKGDLKYPQDAKLHLVIAQLRAGQPARAKEQINSITGTDGAGALARLWLLATDQRH